MTDFKVFLDGSQQCIELYINCIVIYTLESTNKRRFIC